MRPKIGELLMLIVSESKNLLNGLKTNNLMASLTFKFLKLTHPYGDEPSSQGEIWGSILLTWKDEEQDVILIDTQWNLLEIVDWFNITSPYMKEECPFQNSENKSIAELRAILYAESNFDNYGEETRYFDRLEDYFSVHFLKLKGNPSPQYYIGMNTGLGEISNFNTKEKKYNSFKFDMDIFLNETSVAIRQIESYL